MTTTMTMTPTRQLVGMIAIALATGVVFGIAEGAESGLFAGGLILAFVAILYFGRERFDAINVMFGAGDERTRTLYTKAIAFAGNVLIYVIVGWFLVTLVQGEVNETLTLLGTVGGVAFIVGAILASRKG